MLVEWVLRSLPDREDQPDDEDIGKSSLRLAEEGHSDVLESLESAVLFASNPAAAAREAIAWRDIIAPVAQGSRGKGMKHLTRAVRSRHLLALVGCCPAMELQHMFPSILRELLGLLRGGAREDAADPKTLSTSLAAVDELVRRMLAGESSNFKVGKSGSGSFGKGGNQAGGVETGASRQAVVGVLPKLVPAVAACLDKPTSADGALSSGPPVAVALAALGVLEALIYLLRSSMRPHLKRVESASASWLQAADDAARDRAAAVLASLPLCSEGEAWTLAVGRVALEAHGVLHMVWPDDDVDMGADIGASQLAPAIREGGGLLPPLDNGDKGLAGSQQALAPLVVHRFKGLCRILELMLTGDSQERAVIVPVPLILALVERVQRMTPSSRVAGPQAFLPVAQGLLSHGALRMVYPALGVAACRLVDALTAMPRATILRHGRRLCRVLVQGIPRPSAAGRLRAAGYRSVARAVLKLGPSATPHLATPALPPLLAEVRAALGKRGHATTSTARDSAFAITEIANASERKGSTSGGRVDFAMSARKSSYKKQRRAREKEVGRALAAADAAATAAAAEVGTSNGILPAANGELLGARRATAGMAGTSLELKRANASEEREALRAALSCLSRLILCCAGYVPLGARNAVEDVLHAGLLVLSGSQRAGGQVLASSAGGFYTEDGESRLHDPLVAKEFVSLAKACLVTPLADGTRSSCLSVALASFQSLWSHPDEGLAAASRQASAECSAILYPRAAPLHLPYTVTNQARAWGASAVSSHGYPVGWSDAIADAHHGDEDEESLSEANHTEVGRPALQDTSLSLLTMQRAEAQVVTPSAETPVSAVNLLHVPEESSGAPSLPQVVGERKDVAPSASRPAVKDKGKGTGEGKGKEGAAVSDTGSETTPPSSSGWANDVNAAAGRRPASSALQDDITQAARHKRSRVGDAGGGYIPSEGGVTTEARATAGEEHDGIDSDESGVEDSERGPVPLAKISDAERRRRGGLDATQKSTESSSAAVSPVQGGGSNRGGGGGVGGNGEGDSAYDDDDAFDFPSIVDADPDSE